MTAHHRTRTLRTFALLAVTSLAMSSAACAGVDDEDDGVESDLRENTAEAKAVLKLVNDTTVTKEELVSEATVAASIAGRIVTHRNGADKAPGTADDNLFESIAELKAERVGDATMKKLVAYAKAKGLLGAANIDVIFSPQAADATHLVRIAKMIGTAKKTIDIAMYSYSDPGISAALQAATARGVKVRFVFETAGEDKSLEGDALTNSKSGQLETRGVDVRYVNKIMHHKFMLIDGPRDNAASAETTQMTTGSANWSSSAGTKYNENTLIISGGEPKLALMLQREFNHLWEHSRDFVSKPFEQGHATLEITDAMLPNNADQTGYFTSNNFDVTDTTFRTNGKNTVADALVAGIKSARKSIHISSGHMRSRPVAEALIAKKAASPNLDIKVYLDEQEYISKSGDAAQIADRETCITNAGGSASKIRLCNDKGFLFGYELGSSDIDVRYKFYAYRWDNSYAAQMHNKYMVIDGSTLFTGSYNLSDNAEHDTFENMLVFSGSRYASLVKQYESSFASIWNTGEGKLPTLLNAVARDAQIPLVFDPIAVTWEQATDLKAKIRANCSTVDSDEFRNNPSAHRFCAR